MLTVKKAAATTKQVTALADNLRASGLRATHSRVLVLQHLREATSPMSHADLSEKLSSLGINHVTVYRNLNDLAESGLARRIDVGDHVWRFEPLRDVGGHPAGEHAHFVCDSCGDVECLPGVSVAVAGAQKVPKALRKNAIEVQLKGRCDRCE